MVQPALSNYGGTCDTTISTCKSSNCSDASDLQRRVSKALSMDDGVTLTEDGKSLRAILDDVLTPEECRFLVDNLHPEIFIDAGGYESTSNQYTASRTGYSGIGLTELALARKGDPALSPIFSSESDYKRFLEFRERIRVSTEQALNLCPGTLFIDYTHISQKTAGGTHRPHADNCFHYYDQNDSENVFVKKDPTRSHPYANRVAASILYLNDDGYGGGEFYWANRSSIDGPPETIVPPKSGRMTVFTSGIENLHGALPVLDAGGNVKRPSRRIALAMWYVTREELAEVIPEYGQESDTQNEEEEDPNRKLLFEVPVHSMKTGSLRLALGLYLVGQQNSPSKGSWRANQSNENTLHMIFKDQTAMISITLKSNAIIVSRHTDGIRPASLPYQLQESVMLHGLLTELETLAFGKSEGQSDKAEDRLLQFDQQFIDQARNTLPTKR